MIFAIVNVFPLPVTPSRTVFFMPFFKFSTIFLIAFG